jgi:hypothetical protein
MVKIKEVKHSDSEISSEQPSNSDSKLDDEEMEESFEDEMNPFEDLAEEGEEDMDDYDEEGEFEEEFVEDGESGEYDMEEMGDDELEALDQTEKDKRVKAILSQLKKIDDSEMPKIQDDNSESSDPTENGEEGGEDELSDVSADSEARIDAANAMLDDLQNAQKEEEKFEEDKLSKFGQRGINNKE